MDTINQEIEYEAVPPSAVVIMRRPWGDGEVVVLFRPYGEGKATLPWREEGDEVSRPGP